MRESGHTRLLLAPVGVEGDDQAELCDQDPGEHRPLGPAVDGLEGDRGTDDPQDDRHHLIGLHADPARSAAEKLLAGLLLGDRFGLVRAGHGHRGIVSRTDDRAGNGSLAMTTIRLDLGYHGARFAGWAAQPGVRTVQGELEAALERILGSTTPLAVAGRTDAGVHAWGQVASLTTERPPPSDLAR